MGEQCNGWGTLNWMGERRYDSVHRMGEIECTEGGSESMDLCLVGLPDDRDRE